MSAPLLPSLTLHLWGQHIAWALVLAALTGCLLPSVRAPIRRLCMAMVALAACLPGPAGPVYWIALAYQMPSLTSVALALWCLRADVQGRRREPMPTSVWAVAAALGMVLLLDTLALLPWAPLYAWGFGPQALTGWMLLSAVLATQAKWRPLGWTGVLIGLVFAVTRLPTGNVWDAVIDPWLALLAIGVLVRRALRRRQPKPLV